MKKKIYWILPALVIISLIILLLRTRTPFGKSNTAFASIPKSEITLIELSDGREKLSLENKDGKWLLNGEKETRKNAIMVIIRVLKELKIKSPVSPELFDTAVTSRGIKPVRVKVFENHKMLSSFLVYKTQSNPYGNIMKTREGAKPFIVYVPGFDGNIGSVFSLKELYWQPYTIFNLLPSEIKSISFRNVGDTANSFYVINHKRQAALSDGKKELTGYDSTLVNRYLSYYTWIPFESWALNLSAEEKTKIISSPAAFEITANKSDGSSIVLTLWNRKLGNGETDSDRLYGKTQSSDELFVVRYFDIDPLLKKRSYFFGK
jgi:hypothetical protein